MTVKAIATRYGGCHFRSRLEARWAVFFTVLGIRWQYEPQGILVTDRLDCMVSDATRPYLPDFLLPDHGLWVEVKGHLTKDELWSVLNKAAAVSSGNGGGCHDQGGYDMLLLGDVPRQDIGFRLPARLHMHKGILVAYPWQGEQHSSDRGSCFAEGGIEVANDSGDSLNEPERWLLDGVPAHRIPSDIGRAMKAAREARFEFGQTP